MKPIQITAREETRLAEEIRTALKLKGFTHALIEELDLPVERWRAAARAAGRALGRPVQTIITHADGRVHVYLKDWPATARERDIHKRRLRAAVNSIPLLPSMRS